MPSQPLQGVEEQGGGGPQKIAGPPGDNLAVGQDHGPGGGPGCLLPLQGGGDGGTEVRGDVRLLHQQLQFVHQLLIHLSLEPVGEGSIVPAEDLHPGGLAADLVVHDAVARHVHSHVRGGFVGALAQDVLKDGAEHREDLHVPVVVHGGHP